MLMLLFEKKIRKKINLWVPFFVKNYDPWLNSHNNLVYSKMHHTMCQKGCIFIQKGN